MINWTISYILSQFLIIIMYIFLCLSYFCKERKKILFLNIGAHLIEATAFILLGRITGAVMNVITTIRDVFFVMDERRNVKDDKITKRDWEGLSVFIILILLLGTVTYDGWQSILSIIGTILFTISIWQKDTKIYKILGIPGSIMWVGYHIYLKSVFGIILETILLLSTIIGFLFDNKKEGKQIVRYLEVANSKQTVTTIENNTIIEGDEKEY